MHESADRAEVDAQQHQPGIEREDHDPGAGQTGAGRTGQEVELGAEQEVGQELADLAELLLMVAQQQQPGRTRGRGHQDQEALGLADRAAQQIGGDQRVPHELIGQRPVRALDVAGAVEAGQEAGDEGHQGDVAEVVAQVRSLGGGQAPPAGDDHEADRAADQEGRVEARQARDDEIQRAAPIAGEEDEVARDDEEDVDAEIAVLDRRVQRRADRQRRIEGQRVPQAVMQAHDQDRGQEAQQVEGAQALLLEMLARPVHATRSGRRWTRCHKSATWFAKCCGSRSSVGRATARRPGPERVLAACRCRAALDARWALALPGGAQGPHG